jgi:hypothetical protein
MKIISIAYAYGRVHEGKLPCGAITEPEIAISFESILTFAEDIAPHMTFSAFG